MMISTKGRYALRIMLDLAARGNDVYTPLREIAERQGISEKYLESIIRSLADSGMVTGLRGKGGGYRLSEPPSAYSVGAILRITEGSLAPVSCLRGDSEECIRAEDCLTLPLWRRLDSVIDDYLGSITLEDLMTGNIWHRKD